jgi:beta-galactosidase
MKRTNIDRGWGFIPQGHRSYALMMSQNETTVNLPHDFTIASDVSRNASSGNSTGYYEGGIGCYTQYLDIPADWEGKRIFLEIDGAYMNSEVRLNGSLVTVHPYGYTPFHADITPFAKHGAKNRLVVVTNNCAPKTSRWYTGSGLYRHVDLLTAPKVHLAPWSIFAHTDRVENGTAYITVEVSAENHTDTARTERVAVTLTREGRKETAASGGLVIHLPAMASRAGKVSLVVENAAIWDIDNPELYTVTAALGENGEDDDAALFGIRTITVDTKNGLMLNGRTIKIKGGCVHHDNGILGAASFYDSEYRKMELHKRNGFNGIRCAHNPPSRDMLDACNRLGLLVLDEAFDMWRMSDNQNDYHLFFDAWWKRDMELFMKRDRNHPSVFMWSIGNEIQERNGLSHGYELAAELAGYARSLDPTRPISSATPTTFNGLDDDDMQKMLRSLRETVEKSDNISGLQNLGNPFSDSIWGSKTEAFAAPLDVVGYNYLDRRYEEDGKTYPSRVICGTESYPKNIDIVWEKIEKLPFVIGDFTWTSHDYIGEAGVGQAVYLNDEDLKNYDPIQGYPADYPWRTAWCADFDLCGFDCPQLHYRKIVWGSDETYLAAHLPAHRDKHEILSRWSWSEVYHEWSFEGHEGKPVKVEVYSAAEEVALYLNGKSLGKKAAGKANRYKTQFDLCYEPGTLRAVSLSGNREISFSEIYTAGKAVGIRITTEEKTLQANGQSLCFALVEIVDGQGRRVPFDDRKAKATVSGAGTLAAFGNGRPVTEENYSKGEFTSYLGRYLAVVRSGYEAGEVRLRIHIDNLDDAEMILAIRKE